MTIAGSDSGGGAGLQADLKTFAALGVFGTSVVTAVTAQNTYEVRGVVCLDPEFVDLQISTVLGDLPVAAVKTGMLASAANVSAVAARAADGELPHLVVDPVLVTSTGHSLLDADGVKAYLDLLVPLAEVLTPNVHEAAMLTGSEVRDLEDMVSAGHALRDSGARTVLVKGGHLEGAHAPDVLVWADGTTVLEAERVPSPNDHGTGCTLSAAIAALLARGTPLLEAVSSAKSFVNSAIRGGSRWQLGAGHGPLDHFGWEAAPGP
ncbi:MAG TPA: bifunctional hydroxymethylpyrimidine kinase/phosphomethylpyrimidine kinase [Acidimicrobiales bacterium]|nr:bifunctional hydroxymethylpyrimidine kinase/phosphomethylpyrimidine kinase [Acidimicrobiales bacterium]